MDRPAFLTMREYYAGQALAGVAAMAYRLNEDDKIAVASHCIEMADLMLMLLEQQADDERAAEREKGGTS